MNHRYSPFSFKSVSSFKIRIRVVGWSIVRRLIVRLQQKSLVRMGRKDACATMAPVDQYRKQIGKQDYKKTKSALKLTKLKAEAKKSAPGIRDAFLVVLAILVFMLCVYAFFYLNLSTELDMDLDVD
ncbi:triple QxxK/R motif-containing protein isoform X1 [Oncorhynchus mykiss]|uniref:Triple QxxK/R motif-containing protein n=2 Tax=Oncorhynchus mykiss TaxID=8022 RepID=A0A8K9XRC2_ONCMY|nr:triple QxxK/R motif-containing protein isoform X1 [Oncorhynchus mykiss]